MTFYLPEAEEGTLYYNFTSALDKNLVRSDRQYYVDPDKNDKSQYSLDLVAFVPAAGTYGKITLYYKGFDKTGDISYSGALTLTVKPEGRLRRLLGYHRQVLQLGGRLGGLPLL